MQYRITNHFRLIYTNNFILVPSNNIMEINLFFSFSHFDHGRHMTPHDMLKSIVIASYNSKRNEKFSYRTHSIGILIIHGISGKIGNFDDVIKKLWHQS
jgi:hypothetical protein